MLLQIKCTLSSSSPQHGHLFTTIIPKPRCNFDQRAIEYRAIVTGEFDQPRFGNQTSELDQLARAFATLHHPVSRVGARAPGFNPMPRCRRPPQRQSCQMEHVQKIDVSLERTPRPVCAKPPLR
jgi:hypothetical protein